MAKISRYDWEFDWQAWGNAISKVLADGWTPAELGELLGVHFTTVSHWAQHSFNKQTPYPSMTNFIRITNMLDLDPREFWILKA